MPSSKIELRDRDYVIGVIPERASGPGWSNQLVWVLIRDCMGTVRTEAIQGRDFSKDVDTIFATANTAHMTLHNAVLKNHIKLATKV